VLINNWEATYFDFDEEKIFRIAEQASEIGCSLVSDMGAAWSDLISGGARRRMVRNKTPQER
jgi:hypothetical protein